MVRDLMDLPKPKGVIMTLSREDAEELGISLPRKTIERIEELEHYRRLSAMQLTKFIVG